MRAHKPSATARLVAAATLAGFVWGLEPRATPEAVEIARLALRQGLLGRMLLWSIECAPTRAVWRVVERVVLPGFVQHIARRKAWIERWARDSVAAGFERVVVLGAGLDALGLRLARTDGSVCVIEVDHPATQGLKRMALEESGSPSPILVPADLAHESAARVIATVSPGQDAATLAIAEGLLMYMPRERVDRLLDEVAEMTRGRLRVILTFMESRNGAPPAFGGAGASVGAWLSAVGEPFRWGATRDEIVGALERRGLRALEMVGERELAQIWPGAIAEGEVLVVAERAARPD